NLEEATAVKNTIALLRQAIGSSLGENTGTTKPESTNELSAAKQKLMLLDTAAERRLMPLSQVKTINEKCYC
nr:hypothetical protein [Tanacetum cinerariifolium]